jgi:hypothetical protein
MVDFPNKKVNYTLMDLALKEGLETGDYSWAKRLVNEDISEDSENDSIIPLCLPKAEPWRPNMGCVYYIPELSSRYNYIKLTNTGSNYDNYLFDIGLIFKTKEEAIEITTKAKEYMQEINNNRGVL